MKRIYWDEFQFNDRTGYLTVDDFGLTFVSNLGVGVSQVLDFYPHHQFEFCRQVERTKDYVDQIEDYLAGHLTQFDLSLNLFESATPLQKRIWQSVSQIGYGEVSDLHHLMNQVGVGNPQVVIDALMACPGLLIVPTHRIADAPYRGGQHLQMTLLELETLNGTDDLLN